MSVQRSDIPELLLAGMQTSFMTGYQIQTFDIYKQVCMEVPSSKDQEKYPWLGALPKMSEWVSERKLKSMLEHTFTIVNKDFEATIEVDRNALRDDQYGQITLRAQQLGMEARRYYDEYLATVIEANGLCYDGQNFFDTDHSEGDSGSQSNAPSAASGYQVDTAAKCIIVLKLVTAAVSQFKDDAGKLYGSKVTHVMIPTSLEWQFREAFDPSFRGGGETSTTNTYKGAVQIIVNPYLTNNATPGNSAIYWLDLSKPIKPFIFQNRQAPEFVALDKPDSIELFMRKRILYGVDTRFNMGFGDWKLAYKTQGA